MAPQAKIAKLSMTENLGQNTEKKVGRFDQKNQVLPPYQVIIEDPVKNLFITEFVTEVIHEIQWRLLDLTPNSQPIQGIKIEGN